MSSLSKRNKNVDVTLVPRFEAGSVVVGGLIILEYLAFLEGQRGWEVSPELIFHEEKCEAMY